MTVSRVDLILSTLNATEVGTLDSIAEKLRQVQDELTALEQPELAGRAADSIQALSRGDVAEFKRLRAFLQSKVGHLRG
jgi:CRP-like cAMP-binding protein